MSETLYVNNDGDIKLDDSELELKWGFDALYSNLAYRLIETKTNIIVMHSVPKETKGYLFKGITTDIPFSYSKIDNEASLYRMEVALGNKSYFFDVARNDLIADFANAGVQPAIIKVAKIIILFTFILFLIISGIAIRLIVKPVKALTEQIENIKPDDLRKRIDVVDIPQELLPIALEMNDALDRVENSFIHQKRFIADAAHELRTPLTVLLTRLELKVSSSPTKTDLINDVQFISRIVEQLLDLSRAQNINAKQLSSIMLEDVIKKVCAHLAPLAINKEQELELNIESEECLVKIDEGDLTVIIKNLLENAIKHSPLEARIKVSVHKNGFTVEDSGDGIPKDYHEVIFERFWRKNQSDRSGSGLGLAIIKELLSHYDSTINVGRSSELGGTKLIVQFN
ncbi:MAG: HAMP domain-containing histidine kinase [Kangiellaceae bacterium]|nr:HAMP domain-containing histidine kinase [Kangiellaceae bacterium]